MTRRYQQTEFGHEILARVHEAAGDLNWRESDQRTRDDLIKKRRAEYLRQDVRLAETDLTRLVRTDQQVG